MKLSKGFDLRLFVITAALWLSLAGALAPAQPKVSVPMPDVLEQDNGVNWNSFKME